MRNTEFTPYDLTEQCQRYKFNKERLGIMYRIPKSELEKLAGWEFESYLDERFRELILRATTQMSYGDKVVKEEFEVPLHWVDHLKFDINSWAWGWLVEKDHFFFTNIAKAITALKLTPRFRTIPVMSQTIRNYCPHIGVGDNRPHIEFMLQKSFGEDFHG